jgi:hypothetical protein
MKLILSFLVLLTSLTAFAQDISESDSGGMGNGGHPAEIAFQTMGREVVLFLSKSLNKSPELNEISVYDLAIDIEMATIEIKLESIRGLGGKEVCAASYPGAKLIVLNLKCWEKISKSKKMAGAFVLKTYLDLDPSLAGKSSRLASLLFKGLKE